MSLNSICTSIEYIFPIQNCAVSLLLLNTDKPKSLPQNVIHARKLCVTPSRPQSPQVNEEDKSFHLLINKHSSDSSSWYLVILTPHFIRVSAPTSPLQNFLWPVYLKWQLSTPRSVFFFFFDWKVILLFFNFLAKGIWIRTL